MTVSVHGEKKSLMGVWIPATSPLQSLPLTLESSPQSPTDLVQKGQGSGNQERGGEMGAGM